MANNPMLFGGGEATTLNTPLNITGNNLHFGIGQYNEASVIGIANSENPDAKVRFVYGGPGNSGMIFVGNQLVSSKILEVAPVLAPRKVYNSSTGQIEESTTEMVANKLQIKWFGKATDPADNKEKTKEWTSEVELIDRESVAEMLNLVQASLGSDFYDFKAEYADDKAALDTSISGVESHLSSDIITEATGGAVTITPSADANGYKSFKASVNVDNSTVKVVNDKLAVATYAIDKLNEGEAGYSTEWSAQYRLMMTAPGSSEAVQVGDTINIMKDFLVKGAHVCSFKYADNAGTALDYDNDPDIVKGGEVVDGKLPWALVGTSYEQAVLGLNIKYGHTYLHLILNTRPDQESIADDNVSDVYLDFTEIFTSFKGDDEFITISPDGVISLSKSATVALIDASLGITDKFAELDATDTSLGNAIDANAQAINDLADEANEHFDTLDSAVDDINDALDVVEASYLKDVTLEAPKAGNSQFNEIKVTQRVNGTETQVSVDVANAAFYAALNTALNTLQSNDNYLSDCLTWEGLD